MALPEPDRVLATILFTDIVGSTRLAVEHGDRAWRDLLERHHALVRGELARFRGREVDTAGWPQNPVRGPRGSPARRPASPPPWQSGQR